MKLEREQLNNNVILKKADKNNSTISAHIGEVLTKEELEEYRTQIELENT